MASSKKELPVKGFTSKSAWETWLERHHEKSAGLWLEFAKKGSGLVSLSYAEALEVAVCYGWIDGQTASVDAKRYRQRFTPRRARSKWSQINRAAAERLQAEGRVAPAGQRAIEAAQRDGRWAAAYPSPRNLTVPNDLQAELDARPRARIFFDQLDSRNRYAILYRLHDARKPEPPPQRRLEKFVRMLEAGETPH
ncbi:MAG: YdeI/OmpD-associated family protein [Gemmatimonadales bacterium]|nr:YdeI/OmpD-associated family protein [Gemmatimonadales bacterium]